MQIYKKKNSTCIYSSRCLVEVCVWRVSRVCAYFGYLSDVEQHVVGDSGHRDIS